MTFRYSLNTVKFYIVFGYSVFAVSVNLGCISDVIIIINVMSGVIIIVVVIVVIVYPW